MERTPEADRLFESALKHFQRMYFNSNAVLKTAERIAQMDESERVEACHMAEAVQYRGTEEDYIKCFLFEDLPNYLDIPAERAQRLYESPLLDRLNDIFESDVKGRVQKIMDEFFKYAFEDMKPGEIKRLLGKLQRKFLKVSHGVKS